MVEYIWIDGTGEHLRSKTKVGEDPFLDICYAPFGWRVVDRGDCSKLNFRPFWLELWWIFHRAGHEQPVRSHPQVCVLLGFAWIECCPWFLMLFYSLANERFVMKWGCLFLSLTFPLVFFFFVDNMFEMTWIIDGNSLGLELSSRTPSMPILMPR